MAELEVEKSVIKEVEVIVESTRYDVLNKKKPIFLRLGGEKGIDVAVDLFYKYILEDSRVKHHFQSVNMTK